MREKTKINLIGIYLFLFLVSLVSLSIWVYLYGFGDSFVNYLIIISCSGGLGGIIYSIRGFYQNLGMNQFNIDWAWWYLFRPIISMVIGVFVFFLIVGGSISISSVSELDYSKGWMFYSGIAFLAGFSFTQFTNKLEELASTLFTKKKEVKKNDA